MWWTIGCSYESKETKSFCQLFQRIGCTFKRLLKCYWPSFMDIFIRLETLKYKVLRSLAAKKMEIEGLQFSK